MQLGEVRRTHDIPQPEPIENWPQPEPVTEPVTPERELVPVQR